MKKGQFRRWGLGVELIFALWPCLSSYRWRLGWSWCWFGFIWNRHIPFEKWKIKLGITFECQCTQSFVIQRWFDNNFKNSILFSVRRSKYGFLWRIQYKYLLCIRQLHQYRHRKLFSCILGKRIAVLLQSVMFGLFQPVYESNFISLLQASIQQAKPKQITYNWNHQITKFT